MNKQFNFYSILIALLCLSAFFLTPTVVLGQKNPLKLIEGADDLRIDEKTGNYIVRGNVRFVQDETKMYCDSVFYNKRKEKLRAYGNVHINKHDTLNLFCDSLFYNLETEFAKLWGNVRVRDNEYKLETDSLDFYGDENKAVYRNRGTISSIISSEVLKSKIGYLYTDVNNFFFRKDVVYTNEDYIITTDSLQFNGRSKKAFFFGPTHIESKDGKMYCEKGWYQTHNEEGVLQQNAYIDREKEYISGDSLYYNKVDGIAIGRGNVEILDTSNHIAFHGDHAWSNEKEHFSFITGHALAKRFEDPEDTLFIHADTLYNYTDSLNEPKLMLGYYNVKLFKSDMQGVCDSLSYEKKNGEMSLYEKPMLWAKNAQLTGDTITVYEEKGQLQKAFLRLNAMVISEVDTGKYYNQTAGRSMKAYFDSTSLRKVDILGNAKTVYFMDEEEDKDTVIEVNRSGMNRVYASNLTLFFRKGDIKSAVYRDAPDGKMYPMNQIKKKEERVEGFKWDESRRPISWQTMIMNEEEFSAWKIKQKKLKKLLALNSLTPVSDVDRKDLRYLSNKIRTYKDSNWVALERIINDSVYSEKDVKKHDSILKKANQMGELAVNAIQALSFIQRNEMSRQLDIKIGDNVDSLIYFDKTVWKKLVAHPLSLENTFIFENKTTYTPIFDSINQTILEFRNAVLTTFPSIDSSLIMLKEWKKEKTALETKIDSLERLKTPEWIGFYVSDTVSDFVNETLVSVDTVLFNHTEDSLLKSVLDERVGTFKHIEDSLRMNFFKLKKPRLSEEELAAKKITDLVVLSSGEDVEEGKAVTWKTHWHPSCFVNQSLAFFILQLEAFKLDILNVERAVYLQFYRSFENIQKRD